MKDDLSPKPRPMAEPCREPELLHVTWEGPVFDLSGYASSSRSALFGLEEAGVRIRLIPFLETTAGDEA